MPKDAVPFHSRIHEALADLGETSIRSMFGGHGISWREVFFGIVYRERLYFKVDEHSRADYLARGMTPFRPSENRTMRSYYEVPADVIADPEALRSWAREAIRAAQG